MKRAIWLIGGGALALASSLAPLSSLLAQPEDLLPDVFNDPPAQPAPAPGPRATQAPAPRQTTAPRPAAPSAVQTNSVPVVQPLPGVGDVVVGDVAGQVDGELGVALPADRLAAQFGHRLLEDAGVGLEADRGDVPRLLGPQQVAGAADLEVVRGDLEAGPELGEPLQHL